MASHISEDVTQTNISYSSNTADKPLFIEHYRSNARPLPFSLFLHALNHYFATTKASRQLRYDHICYCIPERRACSSAVVFAKSFILDGWVSIEN